MIRLMHGDTVEQMRTLPSESFDACVTDPPAGIAFMGRAWDHDKGGRRQWVAWMTEVFTEVYRVMKPGAHGLVWALPRTSHWTAWALEDAGFEVRDAIVHLFGSGFPKSLDVSKAIDKRGGANIGWFGPWLRDERRKRGISSNQLAQHFLSKTGGETGCVRNWELGLNLPTVEQFNTLCDVLDLPFSRLEEAEREVIGSDTKARSAAGRSALPTMGAGVKYETWDITAPATPEAAQWAGWGTALKPAAEIWWLIRRQLSEKTVAANVLKHGTGALNIDAARIGTSKDVPSSPRTTGNSGYGKFAPEDGTGTGFNPNIGRWPPNVAISHNGPDENGEGGCQEVGTRRVKGGVGGSDAHGRALGVMNDDGWQPKPIPRQGYADADGLETVPAFQCVESCAVRLLDEQAEERPSSGLYNKGARPQGAKVGAASIPIDGLTSATYADSGGPSRFFYTSKASAADRRPYNDWPTVKSTDLMRWLITLVTPPGGQILDPFCGSGSTLVAADRLGFDCVGIDSDAHALDIARRRLHEDAGMFADVTVAGTPSSAAEAFDAIEEAFVNGRPYPYGGEPA